MTGLIILLTTATIQLQRALRFLLLKHSIGRTGASRYTFPLFLLPCVCVCVCVCVCERERDFFHTSQKQGGIMHGGEQGGPLSQITRQRDREQGSQH